MKPQDAWREELWRAFTPLFHDARPALVKLVVIGVVVLLAWRLLAPKLPRRVAQVLVVVLTAVAVREGYTLADGKAALFDDAYISFRYAKNLVDGHGLVFNVGERVEGYTNFLWTVILALAHRVSGRGFPELGLSLSLLAFAANLVVVAWLASLVGRREGSATGFVVLPVAAFLLARQDTFTTFGTTGLETGFASLLVNLGAVALVRRDDVVHAALAGVALILATFTRPDHALFFATGGLVLVVLHGRALFLARRDGARALLDAGLRPILAYAAPALAYALYVVVKRAYYGDPFPNTYYAKSADLSYWAQGAIYARAFFLQSHFWIVLAPFVVGIALALWRGERPARAFALFALPSAVLYHLYVWKVGGDFMHGRFYVSVIPLLVVGAVHLVEHAARALPPSRGLPLLALAALPFVVVNALPIFEGREARWYILDERQAYPVESRDPIVIAHSSYTVGHKLAEIRALGFEPLVATSGVGMVGFYSELPILDLVGLTDKVVARQRLGERGRPGHEKWAKQRYVQERNPHFVRSPRYVEKPYRKLAEIRFGPRSGRVWHVFHYDRALMRAIRDAQPEVRFTDFEAYLDRYLGELASKAPADVARDLVFFRRYYFDHNDDEARLAPLADYAASDAAAPGPASP